MRGTGVTVAFAAVVVAGAAEAASGQADPATEARARLIGALELTIVSARLDAVPAREALRMLSAAAGVHVQGRFADDPVGHGIDPSTPITLAFEQVPARMVLEMILEQNAIQEPVSWQLRIGFVEVGTKERLSAPGAAERRVYPLTDLLIEAPYFDSRAGLTIDSGFQVSQIMDHPYAAALVTRPDQDGRKTPEQLLQEIVEAIVETVEPGNWDYGQMPDDEAYFIDDDPGALVSPGDPGAPRAPGPTANDRPRRIPRKIAQLRVIGDTLVIVAPDFVHRQVGGYPRPRPPPQPTDAQLASRAERATAPGGSITVTGIAQPRPRPAP